ncbi:R3H domain containing protein [Rhodotorula toruloides]|uniref:R3H domain containing protein n=1 Tax=Rhodotorula toruloides TaxID=5286 RepID=A0A511KS19_RHOTO|nr:R3H domain containing protein [Rhodotorula toruloides]
MATFDYADLVQEDMLGFNASPFFQPIPTPQQYSTTHSPAQTGYSTPSRGGRGGRGGAGVLRGGGRGGTPNRSGAATPEHARSYVHGGRSAFRGGPHQGLGVFNARGRGGVPGAFTPGRGGSSSSSPGEYNPLLVPVKFVQASGPGLGTVGGEDEHGLEKAGAAAPRAQVAADAALADEVGRMDLYDGDAGKGPPPPTAFEPQPETTATMALDELEDAHAATSEAYPGLGSHVAVDDADEEDDTSAPMTEPPRPDSPAADEPPLFEISVTRSEVTVELSATIPPPPALVQREDTAEASSSDEEDEEQVVYPPRAVSHADPVPSTRPHQTKPVQHETPDFTSLPTPSVKPPAPKPPQPALPTAPAHKSKKALKRAAKIARKAGRVHARSGNTHLGTGKTLGAEDDDDLEEGRAMFARLQGAAGVDDMLAGSDEDEESDDVAVNGGAEQEHEEGQPRMDDSDLDWGSASPPPVGLGARSQTRRRAKKQLQRQQRADQRQAEKLERLIAAGSTREEIELAMAIEMSIEEAEEVQRQVEGRGKRERRLRQRQRAEEDYLQNADFEEGDDSIAVLAAFAKGAVGGLDGAHERGDDLDRRLVEEAEAAAWGTSDDNSDEDDDSDEEETSDDEEDEEERYIRRLAREEEEMSEDVDSDVELEMDYALGDADGRMEHSLSIASDSDEASDFDSSLLSSTDSVAEGFDVAKALLAGGTVRLSAMGQAGGGGRKAERERKKERRRERKGKMRAMEESDDDENDDDEAMLFQGNDTWADRDEEYIARVQNAVRANADLLSTAQGGRAARRANRHERNKLFKAISEGNFKDVDLYDDAEDLDDEMIEAMFAEEEERGFGSMSKKQRKKDKSFGGAFSSTLADQWELDRQSKARKKDERAALRAATDEAEYRDSYRTKGGKKGKKALKAAREAADQSNDAATVNRRIRHFIVNEIREQSVSLPPMSKKARIAVHLLAEVYGLKSRSMGKGNSRFPVLERTSKTTVIGISERRVRAIVGTAEGENELEDGFEAFGGIGRRGRGGGKMAGLWKALEGASGKGNFGAGGRGGGLGKNSEGAVVGEGADKLGENNIGFALLKKMGWTEGAQIGLSGGILEPVSAVVKGTRRGLGA